MHEYEVTVVERGVRRLLSVRAASAAAARAEVEACCDGEVIAIRFLRSSHFSCAIRDGRSGR